MSTIIPQSKIISLRQSFAESRIQELKSSVNKLHALNDIPKLCIYLTGSFARLEASQHSDVDLFFIHPGSSKSGPISRINKILLDSELIKLSRELNFPEFSNDGEYLLIHYIEDIKDKLGSPQDDSSNYFTARLLLLLESRSIYNDVYS